MVVDIFTTLQSLSRNWACVSAKFKPFLNAGPTISLKTVKNLSHANDLTRHTNPGWKLIVTCHKFAASPAATQDLSLKKG